MRTFVIVILANIPLFITLGIGGVTNPTMFGLGFIIGGICTCAGIVLSSWCNAMSHTRNDDEEWREIVRNMRGKYEYTRYGIRADGSVGPMDEKGNPK